MSQAPDAREGTSRPSLLLCPHELAPSKLVVKTSQHKNSLADGKQSRRRTRKGTRRLQWIGALRPICVEG